MERNYYLMRSPEELIKENLIGYGWEKVNFSKFSDTPSLLNEIKNEHGSYGRKRNQIQRFFNLKSNDVVVTPMNKSIAIGIVIGDKSYQEEPKHGYNRVSVNFKCVDDGIRVISTRTNIITNSLLSRLRLRQTNASLNSFSDEIEELLNLGCSAINDFSEILEKNISDVEEKFKEKLLINLKNGKKLRIKGGGDGFESLICELLKIEGYSTEILSKTSNKGAGDIDITATRDEFFGSVTELVIQAKHHKGVSSIKSLNQVITAIKNGEVATNATPMVISTGEFDENTTKEAEYNNIVLMNGEKFIDWLYRNISKLPVETQLKLGVSQVPALIEEF